MVADIGQGIAGLVPPTEYTDAVELAKLVSSAVGKASLTMVGHSLGGGLADAAALATNRNAVTFNAAGLNDETLDSLNADSYTGTRVNYSVAGEILTMLQSNLAWLPEVGGANFTLQPAAQDAGDNPATLHEMAVMLRALGV